MENYYPHDAPAWFHENLPERIRRYLNGRGIADTILDRHLLGWDGTRITIPIFDRRSDLAFLKLAKDPDDTSDSPKMLTPAGVRAELYGWEHLRGGTDQLVVCEGEFDRLVLESQGFAAVTSTGGAGTFRTEWAEALRTIPAVYVCFDLDAAGETGARRVARLLPEARIVRLPGEVGEGGDVTDFFVRLGRTQEDFQRLLAVAEPARQQRSSEPVPDSPGAPQNAESEPRRLKAYVRLEEIVGRYILLARNGDAYRGVCPFHEDHQPSFVVYAATQHFHCYGCGAHGDVFTFLMRVEHLTFPQALTALRKLAA